MVKTHGLHRLKSIQIACICLINQLMKMLKVSRQVSLMSINNSAPQFMFWLQVSF